MKDLTKLVNDIQRSVIEPNDRIDVVAAVQHYYKHLASVGYIKKEEANIKEIPQKTTCEKQFDVLIRNIEKFNKEDLLDIGQSIGLLFKEDDTKKDMINAIKPEVK